MLFMKVAIFSTHRSAMPLSFSNFDFLPIYKANSAGSRTYPFIRVQVNRQIWLEFKLVLVYNTSKFCADLIKNDGAIVSITFLPVLK